MHRETHLRKALERQALTEDRQSPHLKARYTSCNSCLEVYCSLMKKTVTSLSTLCKFKWCRAAKERDLPSKLARNWDVNMIQKSLQVPLCLFSLALCLRPLGFFGLTYGACVWVGFSLYMSTENSLHHLITYKRSVSLFHIESRLMACRTLRHWPCLGEPSTERAQRCC